MKEKKKQLLQQHQHEHLTKVYISDPDYVWLPASITSIKKCDSNSKNDNISNSTLGDVKEETEAEVKIDLPSNWSSTTATTAAPAATVDRTSFTSYYEDAYGNYNHKNKKDNVHHQSLAAAVIQQLQPQQQQQKQTSHTMNNIEQEQKKHKKFCISRNNSSNNNNDSVVIRYTPGYYEWSLRRVATTTTNSSSSSSTTYNDLVDIPFCNEASVLYNLKERYCNSNGKDCHNSNIYTRVNRDIILAINPYEYIPHYYTQNMQQQYANQIVWNVNNNSNSGNSHNNNSINSSNNIHHLEPHVYESSSFAYKQLLSFFNDDDAIVDDNNDDESTSTAATTVSNSKGKKKDQTIIVSGESGAGKTETVKLLVTHLTNKTMEQSPKIVVVPPSQRTTAAATNSDSCCSSSAASDALAILEAFGNAATTHNTNSSRFGKLVTLYYDSTRKETEEMIHSYRNITTTNIPTFSGMKQTTFLLEKNRVVFCDNNNKKDERSFHIFYQLLSAPNKFKNQLLPSCDANSNNRLLDIENCHWYDFKYLMNHNNHNDDNNNNNNNTDGCSDNTSNNNIVNDTEMWYQTINGLKNVCNIQGETLLHLMRTIMTILQLGNITFFDETTAAAGAAESSSRQQQQQIELLSSIIGIQYKDLQKALTKRILKTTHDEVAVKMSATVAKHSCDSFAKEIYARIFDRVVREVNEATDNNNHKNIMDNNDNEKSIDDDGSDDANATSGSISILDMFGFECYSDSSSSGESGNNNHFYQLCINYANEQLQQKYVVDNFGIYKEEYEPEGIRIFDSLLINNVPVLNLLDGGKWKNGIIDLINGECRLPKGNESSFVSEIKMVHKNHIQFVTNNNDNSNNSNNKEFTVTHYTGYPVTYNATNFIQQNTDMLPESLISIAANKSTNPFIRSEFKKLHFILQLSSNNNNNIRGGFGIGGTPPAGINMDTNIMMKRGNNFRRFQSKPPSPASFLMNRNTVLENFRKDMNRLLSSMKNTNARYIRCLKPNNKQQPKVIDHKMIVQQCKSIGTMTAIALGKEIFTDKLDYKDIISRYECCYKYYYNNNNGKNNNDNCNKNTTTTAPKTTTTALATKEEVEEDNNIKTTNNSVKNLNKTKKEAAAAAAVASIINRDKVESMFSVLFQFLVKDDKQQKDKIIGSTIGGGGSRHNKKQQKQKKKKKNQKEQKSSPLPSSTTLVVAAAMAPLHNNYCVYGKTKVFFLSGAIDHLEKQRHHVRSSLAVNIQKWIRMVLSVQKYKKKALEHRIVQYDSIIDDMMLKYDNNSNSNDDNNNSGDKNKNGSSNNSSSNNSSSNRRRPRRRLSLPTFGSSKSSDSNDDSNNNNAIVADVSKSNNDDINGFNTYYNNSSPFSEYDNNNYYQYPNTTLPPSSLSSPLYISKQGEEEQKSSLTHIDHASTSNYFWNSETNAWQQQKPQEQQAQQQETHKPARRRMSLPLWGQQESKPQQQQPPLPQQEQEQEQQSHKPARRDKSKNSIGSSSTKRRPRRRLSLPSFGPSSKSSDSNNNDDIDNEKCIDANDLNTKHNNPLQSLEYNDAPSPSSYISKWEKESFTENNVDAATSSYSWNSETKVWQQQNPQEPQQQEQEQKTHKPARRRMSLPLWGQQQEKPQQEKPQQEQEQEQEQQTRKPARRRMSLPLRGQQQSKPQQEQESEQEPESESSQKREQSHKPARRRMSLQYWKQSKPESQPETVQQHQNQSHIPARRSRRRLSLPLSYNNSDDSNDDNLGVSERVSSGTIPSSLSGKKKRKSRLRFSLLSSFGSAKGKEDPVSKGKKKDKQQQQSKQQRHNPFSPKRFLRRSSKLSPQKDSYDTNGNVCEF